MDSTASTIVGPLFQRAPRVRAQHDQDNAFYDDNSTEAVFLAGGPRRYPPERHVYPSKTTTPFLAGGLTTALHYSNEGHKQSQLQTPVSRLRTARRRDQCRVNQARYRLKQEQKVQLLSKTVPKLREEIPLLKLQRDRVLFGTKQSVFNVVVEYFHLFRYGIRSLKLKRCGQDPQAQQQLVFLRISMATGVRLGERSGVGTLVEQWRRYSSYFEDLHFQLEHMEEPMKNLVAVSASMSVTVTEMTLRCVFPHLANTKLSKELLGRHLMLPCSLWVEWDDARRHIVRLEMSVDFLMPVSRVLNSLKDAAFVLGQALITRDGSIGKFDL